MRKGALGLDICPVILYHIKKPENGIEKERVSAVYYVLLAEGFEEIEALTQTDVLRRAGVDVKNVGVTGEYVTGSHGITVKADVTIEEAAAEMPDGIILPGGIPGTHNIAKSAEATAMIQKVFQSGHLVAAICAAPSVLGGMGLLKGRKAACYPGYEEALIGATPCSEKVVVDGNVITSRGAGTAMDMALTLAEYITGNPKEALASAMIYE